MALPPYYWLVTFVTHNARVSARMVAFKVKGGEPLVLSPEEQRVVAEGIAAAARAYGITILAGNVLPDHVHLVVGAASAEELNENIRKVKGYTSRAFSEKYGAEVRDHLWAQKFNRRFLREEAALAAALTYVERNHYKHADRWGEGIISTHDKFIKPVFDNLARGKDDIRQGA